MSSKNKKLNSSDSKNLNYSPYSDFYEEDNKINDISPDYAYDYRQYKIDSVPKYNRGDFSSRYKVKSGKQDKLQAYERIGILKRALNILSSLTGLVIVACLIALNLNSLGLMPLTLSDSFISVKLYNFDFGLIILACALFITLVWCFCFSGKARFFSLLIFCAIAIYVGIIYFMNWQFSARFLKYFNFGFSIFFITLSLFVILSEGHLKYVKVPSIIFIAILAAGIICRFVFLDSGLIIGAAFNLIMFMEIVNWILLISIIILCVLLTSFWARKKIKTKITD